MSITRLSPISTRSFSLLEKQALAGYRPHFPTQGKTWAQLHPNGPRKRKLPTPTPSPTPWTADFEPLGGETSRHDVTSFEEGLEEEGGWYEKSEKEGVSLTKERKRELWTDPYGELAFVFVDMRAFQLTKICSGIFSEDAAGGEDALSAFGRASPQW